MSELFGNGIVQGVLATLIVALLAWGWTRIRFRRDEAKIVGFLEESEAGTKFEFRSTQAIASALNLTAARIEKVCGPSRRIRRNGLDRESWTLANRERNE